MRKTRVVRQGTFPVSNGWLWVSSSSCSSETTGMSEWYVYCIEWIVHEALKDMHLRYVAAK